MNDTGKAGLMTRGMKAANAIELTRAGQSVWLDFISAGLIESGDLREMVEEGLITGMTSNPTIFAKAIGGGESGYEDRVRALRKEGKSTFEIYDEITRRDIGDAADILRPVYDRTKGADGYVSLEASPELAYEEDATVSEALRLFGALNRRNVMIKVPATDEGIAAVRRLLAFGVNINVTLIFSPTVYRKVAHAYVGGLREFGDSGGDVSKVASVASFFVSRVDTAIDKQLDEMRGAGKISDELLKMLRGKLATANARVAYQDFLNVFQSPAFAELKRKGARPQRVLWASTSTKDPAYPDLKYVEPLEGPQTVNTMPQETLEAFLDHGTVKADALASEVAESGDQLRRLAEAGIDFERVCEDLLRKGVDAFARSFHELLDAIQRVK